MRGPLLTIARGRHNGDKQPQAQTTCDLCRMGHGLRFIPTALLLREQGLVSPSRNLVHLLSTLFPVTVASQVHSSPANGLAWISRLRGA